MDFSIYNSLADTNIPVTLDWKIICTMINNLPTEHIEVLCALILHNYVLETDIHNAEKTFKIDNSSRKKSVIYSGKIMEGGNGILFSLKNLPIKLQLIISNYIHTISTK
jgi:hypothetical protein